MIEICVKSYVIKNIVAELLIINIGYLNDIFEVRSLTKYI